MDRGEHATGNIPRVLQIFEKSLFIEKNQYKEDKMDIKQIKTCLTPTLLIAKDFFNHFLNELLEHISAFK